MNVKTNIGKCFFKLLKKHFPRNHTFHKIFNKNTIKISYSCFPNMNSIISSHNKKIIKPPIITSGCNCTKGPCPVQNNCLAKKVIYRADITNDKNNENKFYIGQTATTFKARYANHLKSFKNEVYITDTELSKYIWELKKIDAIPTIKWSILKQLHCNLSPKSCQLCLNEKMLIIDNIHDNNILNQKSEFISKCRHQRNHMLSFIKDDSHD